MERDNQRSTYVYFALLAVFAAAFALFFYLIPTTLDDWAWGGTTGMLRLKELFSGYNGRYLGNIFAITLNRSLFARIVIMTTFSTLLIYEISKDEDENGKAVSLMLSGIILLSTIFTGYINERVNIFNQTIAWASGFSNYVIPSCLILVYLNALKYEIQTRLRVIILVIIGFSTSLFLENVTICMIIFSGCFSVASYINNSPQTKERVAYFVSTLTGGVVMLSNSSYSIMINRKDGLERSIGFIKIDAIKKATADLGISIKVLIIGVAIALIIYALLFFLNGKIFVDEKKQDRGYYLLICIGLLTAPLLFANGGKHAYLFTARVYFPQIVLLTAYITSVICELLEYKPKILFAYAVVCVVAVCALFAFIGTTYVGIHSTYAERDAYIAQQIKEEKKTIKVKPYPEKYKKYVYMSDSYKNKKWSKAFKDYYKIPPKTRLKDLKE